MDKRERVDPYQPFSEADQTRILLKVLLGPGLFVVCVLGAMLAVLFR